MAYRATKWIMIGDVVLLAGAFTLGAQLDLVKPEEIVKLDIHGPSQVGSMYQSTSGSTLNINSLFSASTAGSTQLSTG